MLQPARCWRCWNGNNNLLECEILAASLAVLSVPWPAPLLTSRIFLERAGITEQSQHCQVHGNYWPQGKGKAPFQGLRFLGTTLASWWPKEAAWGSSGTRFPGCELSDGFASLQDPSQGCLLCCKPSTSPEGQQTLSAPVTLSVRGWSGGHCPDNGFLSLHQLNPEGSPLFHPEVSLALFYLFVKLHIPAKGLFPKKNSYCLGQWIIWNHFIYQ